MNCNFGSENCQSTCPKFPICMYKSIQIQLSEINTQLSFILTSLTHVINEEDSLNKRIEANSADISEVISSLISILNDSEKIQQDKESKNHEKIN